VYELLRTDLPLPAAPGESPFHVRGFYYDRVLARIRKEGGNHPLELVQDERVRAFFDQKFSWNGWYDFLPIVPLYAAIAAARGTTFEQAVRDGSRKGALEMIPSLFRLALRITSPQAVAAHVGSIVTSTTDCVQVQIDEIGEGFSASRGIGIPLFLAPHTVNLFCGFVTAILEMRGESHVQARCMDVERAGARQGFEIVTAHYRVEWTPRGARTG